MTRKQKRLAVIGGGVAFLVAAVLLVMFAFSQSIAYFYVPGDLAKANLAPGTRIRLGGLVEAGSVQRGTGQRISFGVTDGKTSIKVGYDGLLPDLFREGQGVVTEGVFEGAGRFKADSVLAKHDETYMPREVADALKKQGHWQPGETKPGAPAAPATK